MNKLPAARIWKDERPLELQYGSRLQPIEVAYETWGRLNGERDNAVLILPAFSAHSHARSSAADPKPGWWEAMIGPGLAFDTDRWYVVCASLLGGCYGTTGPPSLNPSTGRSYAADFPIISVRDIVNVQARLLDHLGIDRVQAAAGGSLGGMEALELAVHHPSRAAKIIALAATERTRPYTATIRRIGRLAIMSDPKFKDGYYDEQPASGLKLARELGTIYYRSRSEFNQRFSCRPLDEDNISIGGINFDFESYLNHQGGKAPKLFDANTYLRLSLAMDLHDVTRGYGSVTAAFSRVQAESYIVGTQQDLLIPIDEQEGIYKALRSVGKKAHYDEMSSLYGHDAFLKEFDWMTPRIQEFLAS
ncbi:MAG TPA: homoserine O-acetyltransferase [Acidobacteriota bacterium]|nr:homoserine O-acetyltransferase [Acidobacteriota bacterium]